MTRGRAATARARVVAWLAAIVAIAPAIAETADHTAARPIPVTAAASATGALGDPLKSAECQRALAALNAEETAVAESARVSSVARAPERRLVDIDLAPARRQATRACLARRADPATLSSELVRPPPLTAPPLAVAPASSPTPTAGSPRAAPPAAPADRPYAITSCDSGGCWANDGSRLNRVGPNLWGPRGICTVQGSLVQCP